MPDIKKILTNIPSELPENKRWQVLINDKEVLDISSLDLINPSVGHFRYGLHPSGQWAGIGIRTQSGGGTITLPYIVHNDEVYIGLISQYRPYASHNGNIYNIPRNHLAQGESHQEAVIRIMNDFFLKHFPAQNKPTFESIQLGQPVNKDTALFVTFPGEGIKIFGCQLKTNFDLSELDKHKQISVWPEKITISKEITEAPVIFKHWSYILESHDGYTVTSTGKLMAYRNLIK